MSFVEMERHMTKHSRLFLSFLATLLVGTLWAEMAKAQSYPSRPITVIIPFAVGGLTDVPVRVLTAMLQERIGQNLIVENKPGGSGTIGGALAARAQPDGVHTVRQFCRRCSESSLHSRAIQCD